MQKKKFVKRNIIKAISKKQYNLPPFSLKNKKEYDKKYGKKSIDISKHKKNIKDIKELKQVVHKSRRKHKLNYNKINVNTVKGKQITEYRKKITAGKDKGKYKKIKSEIYKPPKNWYAYEKIVTDKGDKFFMRYGNLSARSRILKKLYMYYDFNSFKSEPVTYKEYKNFAYVDKSLYKSKKGRRLAGRVYASKQRYIKNYIEKQRKITNYYKNEIKKRNRK